MQRTIAAYAAAQLGLVTRTQALGAGLTEAAVRWRVESGRWVAVQRGVYSTTPGRDDWESRALAALLRIGIPAALCGPSAGFLWGLIPHPGPDIHVAVPVDRRPEATEGIVVTRSQYAYQRTDERAWPHRISLDHTVFDLAAGRPVDRAVGLIAKAVQTRRTTLRNLRNALEQRPGQAHRTLLLEVLGDVEDGPRAPPNVATPATWSRRTGSRQRTDRPPVAETHGATTTTSRFASRSRSTADSVTPAGRTSSVTAAGTDATPPTTG